MLKPKTTDRTSCTLLGTSSHVVGVAKSLQVGHGAGQKAKL